ncbi:MAG: redoxin [Flavobacteriales bacterium]|nr:redoxin [Flavobacteriales bacterium]|tara:strand:- start:4843 stop:5364 length:522 start_codon:yes stop_codon:yes gene_type:complete
MIKNFIKNFLLVFPVLLYSQNIDTRGFIVKQGQMAPDFEFKLLNGELINNESLLGKTVVLQFTASWCSVCRKEMPQLELEVWQRFKEEDFMMFGIDLMEDVPTTKDFAEKMAVTYPMASDLSGDVFALFAGPKQGVTRNIVLNNKGRIIFLTRLYERDEFEEMISVIVQELKE